MMVKRRSDGHNMTKNQTITINYGKNLTQGHIHLKLATIIKYK